MGKKVIIAGGGTGGHIFPAIAIANALKKIDSSIEILFVGAKGRMEMDKVPQAGYKIEGLDIAGFSRSSLIKNIGLPYKLVKSFLQVRTIFKKFKPDAAIGVGGYSSFPVLRFAQARGIKTFIHESNSFAGKANIMLGKNATKIFTGTGGMEKFFPATKILVLGNPVRLAIAGASVTRSEGIRFFSLNETKKTVLVVGGSLGAKSINEAIDKGLDDLLKAGLQIIWQTGKPYSAKAKERANGKQSVWVNEFITQMEYAYAAADIVVARAGAMTVAELCVAKKPVLFVPYPFAAEDHQTVNAMQLVNKNAALMVKDNEVMQKLVFMTIELSMDESKQEELKKNIAALAIIDADKQIAEEIFKTL
ncbi:MAG: undecaprenyldiphospho-muramoylpentapeptide beta-N-acetylglucosaminyltransferase [Chitinophagaceae bacterium]|jgi:UDP-N-acetylglucosamine--N-acetylmuramyl-(pentapeptide) pyrophosphoryl-undecaprenol N-acetylglucosamine transferase|nr:undecaprenyldiphospho-muramoylpentapeptide beta-N-acetylglucosaminyltransferase [Chitinophagaceae bacterium]MBK8299756.1 undecaprenyldiphospho-muramoylpentapeptide beta-N-acetylglucosaminyltransferase [Chitinophagaceae bacterium]MBK9463805.1 undecaprenyldiphospho-muramoylpentapeptide beta-N-acetylglucosaminyltransferase [Chitinophagaceae bacterium]MBK9659080.1 undecaprenyldiphospho-muramoylpentapeptide beta-N-acetylglucosaminyltransferase [Chitinophagaceae bacterium]MBP6233407.1 undecaprenyl